MEHLLDSFQQRLAFNVAISLEHELCSEFSWHIRISRPPYPPFSIDLRQKCLSPSRFLVDNLELRFSTTTTKIPQLIPLLSGIPLLPTICSYDQKAKSRAKRKAAVPPSRHRHCQWTIQESSSCDCPPAPFNFPLQA